MPLKSVSISRFRCLSSVELELDPKVTLIVGRNASGKTSLLEALFFLGRGRSFRTRRLENLVQKGMPDFRVVGRVSSDLGPVVLGIQGRRGGVEIRVGGQSALSVADLAAHFAPQIIDPEVHKLLEEGPARRRRFLDWGVFHVEPSFLTVWQRFHRALRQRNAALKSALSVRDVSIWDTELVAAAEILATQRDEYIGLLNGVVAELGRRLLGAEICVRHERGWERDQDLLAALSQGLDRDRRFRATQSGPQRADVVVLVDGMPAKDRVSRGQQKLLAAGLVLAQMQIQEARQPEPSALLLDDPAAELDADNLARLMMLVSELRSQLIVTSLRNEVPGLPSPGRVFHVEHGKMTSD